MSGEGYTHGFHLIRPFTLDSAEPKMGPLTQAETRQQLEREAMSSEQPHGWGNQRVYQSMSGPRWMCCGKPFTEEHSPWCPASGWRDPLPS